MPYDGSGRFLIECLFKELSNFERVDWFVLKCYVVDGGNDRFLLECLFDGVGFISLCRVVDDSG